ncbi:MAG: NAD-dependent deacetylase [Pirellulales bacterium]
MSETPLSRDLQRVAELLLASRRVVAFSGAGISTESGIPDFRSPGGVWTKYRTVYYQEFLESADARLEYWRQKAEAHRDFAAARPNLGHAVLARWEASGRLQAVITQNIDGLHQEAGNRTVLELHGTAREIACVECGQRSPADPLVQQFLATGEPPLCLACGGFMKHATVSFGQILPPDVMYEATRLAKQADLFLALGSSLVVEPAASLPRLAQRHGGKLIIINRDATPQDDLAEVVLHCGIGTALTAIDAHLAR